ncbi:hypothetical protein [Halostagnicola sp. A56]|uniref:hypothetical protein n=1 Tax=Halostagnicola sp. A56 TaxID=1495067 RepID=UPI0006797FE7|nr:hypothetical protein [Halostagnicola sp. A56]
MDSADIELAGFLFLPTSQDKTPIQIFIVLGATGIFAGLLTYFLTPEQFVAASVGERVYAACASRETTIAEELGLQGESVYIPREEGEATQLFVPLDADYSLPDEHRGPLVLESETRGLLVETTGGALFKDFEQTVSGELSTRPNNLAVQLCDGLVDGFELATRAEPDIDTENHRITVAITESAYGAVDRFDHPISSFLAVGFAIGLDQPVRLTINRGGERSDWLVTCEYNIDTKN